MKKKSMISALVLSVAMIGFGTSSSFAVENTIDNASLSGVANGIGDPQVVITDTSTQPDPTIYNTTWGENDRINISNGSLTILGYTADDAQDPVVNGILNATGGSVTLEGDSVLSIGSGSSVLDAVAFEVQDGSTVNQTSGTIVINGNDSIDGDVNLSGGIFTVTTDGDDNITGTVTATGGTLVFAADATLDNTYVINGQSATNLSVSNGATLEITNAVTTTGTLINRGTIDNDVNVVVGTLNNSGNIGGEGNLTVSGGTSTNRGSITQGTFTLNGGTFENVGVYNVQTEQVDHATLSADTIVNNGTITLSYADLFVTGNNQVLGGRISAVRGENNLSLNGGTLNGELNVEDAILNFTSGTIAGYTNENAPGAAVNIAQNGTLNLGTENEAVTATFDANDQWLGDVNLINGNVTVNGGAHFGTVGYSQDGNGTLTIDENSSLKVKDASKITGGNMIITTGSTFASAANGFTVTNLNTAGTVNGINGGRENYNADTITIGSAADPQTGVADTQADFAIDILGRSNGVNNTGLAGNGDERRGSDQFIADNIVAANNDGGTINISDWTLNGDIYGWQAPIERRINLDGIFQGNIAENINIDFTATDKEVFTPIGWYKLNTNPNTAGSYTLDLARFNPWVFRGQVTKLAQYQNQLAIDDMLFTHSMVLPSFKENDHGANASILANRYAAAGSPLYAPYDYSRKDGGVWCKMYGNFEHLNMNRGLNVENNSFGALIGADLGLKELSGGWTFMPTAYIGYNGAHQNYAHNGAWQNGGQAGFLGTWYKDNFIIGALVYGGVYNNEMDTPRGNDDAFNYFAGGSVKTAYNWRFHRDWVLQPNFLVAYNFFGKENWHSDFGQMGMMSGQLHGVNVAPGLNLIWEKDTFSAYATLQYMYNVNQAVGGRAGYVGLPHIHMDRGYIQYGLGFNKRFGDRFSGYLQAVFRNVGRTGVGFQGGFNFALGKNPSNYNAKLKGHTPIMQKAKLKTRTSHS